MEVEEKTCEVCETKIAPGDEWDIIYATGDEGVEDLIACGPCFYNDEDYDG